ncbi:MAG: hypothetical protein JXR70_17770 [Spirochaetales bacterium]|nr:hypothetical protein [Spirochaetales bacterium]
MLLVCFSCIDNQDSMTRKKPLLLYVGGTMRPVMEEIVNRYSLETGQLFELDYAGSGELLIRM